MTLKYRVELIRLDITEKNLELVDGTIVLEAFYQVEVDDMMFTLGSIDRFLMFKDLHKIFLTEYNDRERDKIKKSYGMNYPDYVIMSNNIKRVLRVLKPVKEIS